MDPVTGPTPYCPLGRRCESCGTERGPLTVVVVSTDHGLVGTDSARTGTDCCLTVCSACGPALATTRLPITAATAGRLVAEHAHHLALSARPETE